MTGRSSSRSNPLATSAQRDRNCSGWVWGAQSMWGRAWRHCTMAVPPRRPPTARWLNWLLIGCCCRRPCYHCCKPLPSPTTFQLRQKSAAGRLRQWESAPCRQPRSCAGSAASNMQQQSPCQRMSTKHCTASATFVARHRAEQAFRLDPSAMRNGGPAEGWRHRVLPCKALLSHWQQCL